MNGNDQDYQISWETDRCSVRVDMEGDIRFADDDRGIESMDRSARFEMEVRIGRDVRRVLVEREGGANVYRYWVGRDEQSWDARAQDWFATVLPELFRHTTFNAGPGVERFLSQGDPNAVFTEVEQIHSDHVAGIYLELLMERADLSTRGISPSGDSSMFSGFSTKQARSTRWPRRSSGSRAPSRWAATPGRRSFAWRRTWTASDNGIAPWPLWRAAAKGAEPTLNHPGSRGPICPSSGFAGAVGPVGR